MKNIWIIAVVVVLATAVATRALGGEKKEVFVTMDYSTCGYHASETRLPDVRNVVFVGWREGDCGDALQKAIDYVASLKADRNGHRGAVLIGEGTFRISSPLRISASGVVLRGSGRGRTVIVKDGFDRGALLYIEGTKPFSKGDTTALADIKVKAGATKITLAKDTKVKAGDRINIVRPSTKAWIASLGCDDFGGGLDYTGWKAGDIDISWSRVVATVDGRTLTLDAPLTTAISPDYGGAMIITTNYDGELTECGVENMTLRSAVNTWNANDEDHCWDAISMDNARDCWVRRVGFERFAGSAVNLQRHTSRITVEDCVASEPVSEQGGWRRGVFITRGEQTLFQRCVSKQGIHDFAAGYCAAGPNAFVQCEALSSLGFSGSIGSWAAGLLFDIVNIDGNDISFKNLEQFQFGSGWNTANSMMWQCTGSTLWCYSPDEDNRNSANGCWGTLTGNGEWTNSNNHVQPRSLFYSQLEQRMGKANTIDGYILPRNTTASSSPTEEQAAEMARLSLTVPRLTLEQWLDSVPYTASIDSRGVRNVDNIKGKKSTSKITEEPVFKVTDGRITANGCLVVGDRYQPTWWAGRVKDNFVANGAKPAITRFVPGREGMGWTDRLDSVVAFMERNGHCLLDHNYGLWYDLRRTDHERVKRADGDVWAPFYEQPFSRTGKGTAYDGLSRYDLTKPNQWYWQRLADFASKAATKGMMLFHENYFQHNILEAGAHWVDCPWRPVNNVNGTSFPEPVPFTGDKRIFMAEQFYDVTDTVLRPLHEGYIRMCLDMLKDHANVVQLTGEEYTGPLHFTQFWLQTVAAWERETGHHPLIALSCTKDAQDSILADETLAATIDIIDIRYWHYKTDGIWAPAAGRNMAPRQFKRKMKTGKTDFAEVYNAVREYRRKYPQKAVTYFGQEYQKQGWAVLMAGGSCPNIPVSDRKFLTDVAVMDYRSGDGGSATQVIGREGTGYVVLRHTSDPLKLDIATGRYRLNTIDKTTGTIERSGKTVTADGKRLLEINTDADIVWLEFL